MGRLEYHLLGSVRATRDGDPVAIGRRHPRAVMTLLLLQRGNVVPVETLVEALWPANAPRQPVTALQGYISTLRRALGDSAIETRPGGYVLHAEPEDVDADRFAGLLENAERGGDAAESLLREALGLWAGPALADFAYDGWAQEHARRLEELRLVAIEQLNDLRLARGDHRGLLPELEGLVRQEPLRERFCEQYMLALARSGRQADALAAYHDLRTRLADEIGIDPSRAVRALYLDVLQQHEGLEPPPRTTLRLTLADAVAFAETWATSLRNFEDHAFAAVAARSAELAAAFDEAIEAEAKEEAARLLTATWFFWIIRGAQEEADRWAQAILALPRTLAPDLLTEAQIAASELARVNGNYHRAIELKKRIREAAERSGEIDVVAGADADLAHLSVSIGEIDAAEAYAQRALELRRSNPNDMCGVGHALAAVGAVLEARGQLDGAISAYEDAVADQEQAGFSGEAAFIRGRLLGRAHRKCGNTRAAYGAFRRALEQAEPLGDYGTSVCALQGLAWVAMSRGDGAGAVRLLAQASRPAWQAALTAEERSAFADDVATLRHDVPAETFEAAWRVGAALPKQPDGYLDGVVLA